MSGSAGHEPAAIRPELLADPQAGQLDGATAAALPKTRSGPAHSVRHTPPWQVAGLVAGVELRSLARWSAR